MDIGKFMFSVLGNIFPVTPRQAESADARLEIRRHDPEQERKKKSGKEGEEEISLGEDNATLSVEALSAFLTNFLKSQEEEAKARETKNKIPEQDELPEMPAAPPATPTGQNARAASAYQSTQRAVQGSSYSGENTEAIAAALHLGAAEIRTIHVLIEDLKELSERKIQHITIGRSTSFLQSLVDAVARAKNS